MELLPRLFMTWVTTSFRMTQPYPITNDYGDESFLSQFILIEQRMKHVLSLERFGIIEDHSRLILLLRRL